MLEDTYDYEFIDDLDEINDQLTVFCKKTFTDYSKVIDFVEQANMLLRTKGLYLHHSDIENIRASLEDLSEKEAVSFTIPVYQEDSQSDYNLVVTYYRDSEDGEYEIDMELQYFWETEIDEDDFEDSIDYSDQWKLH